jgi:hypothetical protein
MIAGIHPEVLLASGYALFLVVVVIGLEFVARQSHQRSEGLQLAGFQYHHEHDAWECPTGQRLGRSETDHHRRVIRYRAPAHICNCCGIKGNCTDSDDGRLIERPLDSWLRSEIRRFHRGISLVMVLLAALILLSEIVHYGRPRELLLLGGFLTPIGIFGVKIASEFWSR